MAAANAGTPLAIVLEPMASHGSIHQILICRAQWRQHWCLIGHYLLTV